MTAFEPGSTVELVIDGMAAGGSGVARHEGRVVFVPRAAPGDRLRCRLVRVRKRYAQAEIEEILAPGPDRREAPCRHFGRCGGCQWMHLSEEAQERARRQLLTDALVRIGRVKDPPPIEWLGSPRALGYRARARVAYRGGVVGFRAAGSHELIDVAKCLVLHPDAQRALDALRASKPQGEGEVEIRAFEGEAAGLRVSPGSFLQANAYLWDAWASAVAEACGSGDLAVDLYAGVGFYTTRLESSFRRVVAVERASSARDLAHNLRAATVYRSSVESYAITRLGETTPDVVLLNPPRVGCDAVVIDALRELMPRRIVYVSCDPATLARDLARLGPRFELRRVVAIDALPQTDEVEAFIVLTSSTTNE